MENLSKMMMEYKKVKYRRYSKKDEIWLDFLVKLWLLSMAMSNDMVKQLTRQNFCNGWMYLQLLKVPASQIKFWKKNNKIRGGVASTPFPLYAWGLSVHVCLTLNTAGFDMCKPDCWYNVHKFVGTQLLMPWLFFPPCS